MSNKMKTFSVYIFLILVAAYPLYAGQKNDLARLDSVLEIRDTFLKNKKHRIDSIKSRIPANAPAMEKLRGASRKVLRIIFTMCNTERAALMEIIQL